MRQNDDYNSRSVYVRGGGAPADARPKKTGAKKKKGSVVLRVFTVLSLLLFLAGAGTLGYYLVSMQQARGKVETLRAARPQPPAAGVSAPAEAASFSEAVLQANRELHAQNPDFAAWITVDGTAIDYPVMYTPNDMEYYLRRSFDKEYSTHGTPFLASGCNPADAELDNMTIYGHNIQTGDMFGDLQKFKKEEFWQEHRTLQLSTLTNIYTYEIFACFTTDVSEENPNLFRYDHFVKAAAAQEYDNYVSRVNSLAYYDTGIQCEYGDKLLTLSTCASSTNSDGVRTVVVAKRIA